MAYRRRKNPRKHIMIRATQTGDRPLECIYHKQNPRAISPKLLNINFIHIFFIGLSGNALSLPLSRALKWRPPDARFSEKIPQACRGWFFPKPKAPTLRREQGAALPLPTKEGATKSSLTWLWSTTTHLKKRRGTMFLVYEKYILLFLLYWKNIIYCYSHRNVCTHLIPTNEATSNQIKNEG